MYVLKNTRCGSRSRYGTIKTYLGGGRFALVDVSITVVSILRMF